jgi:hypothetical protein
VFLFFSLLSLKQVRIEKVRRVRIASWQAPKTQPGTVLALEYENSSMQKHSKRYIPLILLVFIILPLHAQKKGYSSGYIITHEGETIEGWVKDRSAGTFMELYAKIRFKPGHGGLSRRYSPEEILAYGADNQHFESLPIYEESAFFKFRYYLNENYKRSFLKLIARDKDLSYYHWEYVDGDSNYLDYIPLFYREGSSEMVRVTQGVLGLKRKRLIEYFQDCPDLGMAIYEKELNEIWEVYDFYIKTQTPQGQDNGLTGNRSPGH